MATVGQSDGQLVRDLSLAECLAYDPNPSRRGGWQRFRCCRHQGDRQQSLSVEDDTGKFRCWNASCGIWGTIVEKQQGSTLPPRSQRQEPPLVQASPLEPHAYAIRRAKTAWRQFVGSPAAEYARRRGVSEKLARSIGMGYWRGEWRDEDSEWLTFPLRCPVTGKTVGVAGRNIHSDEPERKARVLGSKGLFGAPKVGPLPEDLILVEGAFEALAVTVSPGLPPARAVIGSSARAEWFDGCRRLVILFDDDDNGEGQKATERLVKDLQYRRRRRGDGPRVLSLKSGALRGQHNCKDLGELLKRGEPVLLQLPPLDPWDPTRADELVRAAYRQVGETMPAGALAWAEEFAPELVAASETAARAIDTAHERQDMAALRSAIAAYLAAEARIAAAVRGADPAP